MMELVAMHLRKEGVYICRTLSFAGCKVSQTTTLFSNAFDYLLFE